MLGYASLSIFRPSVVSTRSQSRARMPLVPIASAISLISFSLTLQANLFQLFQPIGGVLARPLSCACTLIQQQAKKKTTVIIIFIISWFFSVLHQLTSRRQ